MHYEKVETIKRYIDKIIVPIVNETLPVLKLEATHPPLAIFDCFRGQTNN